MAQSLRTIYSAGPTFERKQRLTDEGNGKYLLEWLDENDETLVSMEMLISGSSDGTISANFNLMKEQNKALFINPEEGTAEEVIA